MGFSVCEIDPPPNFAATSEGTAESQDPAAPKRRGKKASGEVPIKEVEDLGPLIQRVDSAYLEELKAKAAEEEAQRELNADPESDPKRINFHRLLLNAAQLGQVAKAEQIIAQMFDADLTPGPRAFHVLVFAYVRGKNPKDALAVARRASDEGFQLLPETYVVLIYAFLNLEGKQEGGVDGVGGPDLETAYSLLESMKAQEGLSGAQPGWLMMCKELFRLGLTDEAMSLVKRGYDDGYSGDSLLNQHVIGQLCKAGLKDRALREMISMEAQGYRPTPDHFNPIIRAVAASGDTERARFMINDAFQRPSWDPPNVQSYDALLSGMVQSLKTGFDPLAAARMETTFGKLREEMLGYSLRPSSQTFAHMCEAYIVLGDADLALGALESLQAANGTTKLLKRKFLTELILTLARDDRPVDVLNILRFMVSDNLRLPRKVYEALPEAEGRSVLSCWMPGHLEQMRRNKGKSMEDNMLTEARQTRVVDGVKLGMSDCVVDDDGVFIAPSKMTTTELQVESEANGLPVDGLTRTQLSRQVKARREALPAKTLEIQDKLSDIVSREAKAAGLAGPDKRDGKVIQKKFRVLQFTEGHLTRISNVVQESFQGQGGFTVERTRGGEMGFGGGDDDDDFGPQGGGDMEDLDDIMYSGVDEGVGDILRDEDTTYGEADDDINMMLNEQAAEDAMDSAIEHYDARVLNKTAGMAVAVELLRSMEMLRARPTGPDLEMLVLGAVTEASPDAALQISERLHRALQLPGYTPERVAAMYSQLARVCLETMRVGFADLVLERAEARSLPLDPSLLADLERALAGRPRQRDLVEAEVDDMLGGEGGGEMIGASAAGLLEDDDDELLDDEVDEGDDDDVEFGDEDEDPVSLARLTDGTDGDRSAATSWDAASEGLDREMPSTGEARMAALELSFKYTTEALAQVVGPEDLEVLKPLLVSESLLARDMAVGAEAGESAIMGGGARGAESELLGEPEMDAEEAFARMQRGELDLEGALVASLPPGMTPWLEADRNAPLRNTDDERFARTLIEKMEQLRLKQGGKGEAGSAASPSPGDAQAHLEFEQFLDELVNSIPDPIEQQVDDLEGGSESGDETTLEPWMMDEDGDEDEEEEEVGDGDGDEEFESRLVSGEWSQEDLDRLVASLVDPRDPSDLDLDETEAAIR